MQGRTGRSSTVRVSHVAAVVALTCFAAIGSASGGSSINTGYFGGVAIEGYDPVAYFTEGRAMKGSEEFAYDWLGARWHFASAEHRDLFVQDPVKYAPQYGGHCSSGAAKGGNTANVDPEAWAIVDGRLYLQYSIAVLQAWERDAAARIASADQKWPAVKARLERDVGG